MTLNISDLVQRCVAAEVEMAITKAEMENSFRSIALTLARRRRFHRKHRAKRQALVGDTTERLQIECGG